MSGIECPECLGTRTRVVVSEPDGRRGSVRRRRECIACRYRWSTLEVGVDRVEMMEDRCGIRVGNRDKKKGRRA